MGATERHEFLRADGESTAGRKDGSGSLRVLVDEMGANVLLSPLFTPLLAQGGTSTLLGTAPRHRATNWGQNTTLFLASMTLGGMGPCLAVVGRAPPTRCSLEAYVEKVLAPTLSAGQIVVMDNLSPRPKEDGCAS